MEAGKLKNHLSLKRPLSSKDQYGEEIQTWSTYKIVWGNIRPLSGREIEHAKQISAEINHIIEIRYNPNVNVNHRAIFGSRTFEIVSIDDIEEKHVKQYLYCKEIT